MKAQRFKRGWGYGMGRISRASNKSPFAFSSYTMIQVEGA